MIKKEKIIIHNKDYFLIYSDQGYQISRDNIMYNSVVIPIDVIRTYKETDQLIKD